MDAFSQYAYFSKWLEFLEKVVGHLAWPIVLIVAIITFRPLITRLLASIRSIKYRDAEASFDNEVGDFVRDVRASGVELDVKSVRSITPDDLQLLILKSWADVEETIKRWIDKKIAEQGVFEDPEVNFSPQNAHLKSRTARIELAMLLRNDVIRPELKVTLDELRGLRNKAAHTSNFDLQAGSAIELAASLGSIEKQLKSSLENFDLTGGMLKV
jgi:hypothetical protein